MKLHVGCGKRFIPGYTHVDICPFPHVDIVTDVRDLSKIASGSCELLYASHVLEYFDRFEAPLVLQEWKRVLDTGGTIRLAVPDFDALLQVYARTGELTTILGPLYGRMEVATGFIYHRTVYNYRDLERMLLGAGFHSVRRYDWRATEHGSIDDHSQAYFPHMEKETGLLVSLNVEATA